MNSDRAGSPEYLGAQRVLRSAHAVKSAAKTFVYLGVCEPDNRPVRFEYPVDMGKTAMVPCFAGCTLPVTCERLYAVTTHLDCDGSCRGARSPFCSCGCGGINHGRVWGQGALLDSRELVESEIQRYRDELVKIAERRQHRAEARAQRERAAFEEWAAQHAEDIGWLIGQDPDAEQSNFLSDMIRNLHNAKILSPNQLRIVLQIATERRERAEIAARAEAERAHRDAERAAKPGAGDQSQLVPGVYKLDGGIYVVKGNRDYISWRKWCREHGECPRPAEARLYAKRLVESAPRITEAGTEIPFTLEYAKGVIYDLAVTDRMPLAEAEELSTRYAKCIVCERTLKAAKSVRASIGPVCIKMFGPTLPEAA